MLLGQTDAFRPFQHLDWMGWAISIYTWLFWNCIACQSTYSRMHKGFFRNFRFLSYLHLFLLHCEMLPPDTSWIIQSAWWFVLTLSFCGRTAIGFRRLCEFRFNLNFLEICGDLSLCLLEPDMNSGAYSWGFKVNTNSFSWFYWRLCLHI